MAKKVRRRGTQGMLTSLVKYPKGSQHKKKESIARKIAYWAGTAAIGAALLAMLWILLSTLFNPEMGKRDGEGDFRVERVEENPPGYAPARGVVAEAFVEIERTRVPIPLTEEDRAGVEEGAVLHVRFEWVPRMGVVRVREWRLATGETAGRGGAVGPDVPAR